VELGPDGGDRGGRIVAEGPPRALAKKRTATGIVLDKLLARAGRAEQSPSGDFPGSSAAYIGVA